MATAVAEEHVLPAPKVDSDIWKVCAIGHVDKLKKLVAPGGHGASGAVEEKGDHDGEDGGGGAKAKGPTDVNAKDTCNMSALSWACRNGNLEVVQVLIEAGADVESVSYGGFRPLHHASNFQRDAIVAHLVECGADVSATDEAGNTALHM